MQVLERSDAEREARPSTPIHWSKRPGLIAGSLLLIYVLLAMLVDVNGHLASDTGGKIGSVEAFSESGSFDLGYWFEEVDPVGRFFPFFSTVQTADGTWINSTTLIMLIPAGFLWSLGGARAILLLPMLGSLLAAFAGRRLHQRLQPGSDGSASMWLIGLASPATVYALTFWEHSFGLGLMLLGITFVLDSCDQDADARSALMAGLAFGAAATMRQEALVYGFTSGLSIVAVWAIRGRWRQLVARSGAFSAGAIALVAANAALEIAFLDTSLRTARAGATFGSTGGVGATRVVDTIGSTLVALASRNTISWVISALLIGSMIALAIAVWKRPPATRQQRIAIGAVILAWAMWLWLLTLVGLVAVPGSAVAAPLSIFGIVGALSTKRWRLPLIVGVLLPVPLIMMTAFIGFGFAQWGGRYHLASTAVLVVMGFIWLSIKNPLALRVMLACTVLVTAAGAAFLIQRTNSVGDTVRQFEETTASETVVVWRDPLVAREFAETARGRNWLSAPQPEDQSELSRLLRSQGVASFLWIAPPDFEDGFVGFTPEGVQSELDHFGHEVILMVAQG